MHISELCIWTSVQPQSVGISLAAPKGDDLKRRKRYLVYIFSKELFGPRLALLGGNPGACGGAGWPCGDQGTEDEHGRGGAKADQTHPFSDPPHDCLPPPGVLKFLPLQNSDQGFSPHTRGRPFITSI